MVTYFDNPKKKPSSQSKIAEQLSFSTAAGTSNHSSRSASTFAVVVCFCSVLSLVPSGELALALAIGAFACAAFGLSSARRDKRLGVTGSDSQIARLIWVQESGTSSGSRSNHRGRYVGGD